MPQARDEAGNIWEVDAQGNAVRLIQPAQQPAQPLVPPNPADAYEAPKAQADARRAQAEAALAAAQAPFAAQLAQAEAARALAEAEKARAEANRDPNAQVLDRGKVGQFLALESQLERIEQLYREGPGSTTGIAGLADYLPTDANAAFDSAGAGLSEVGLAAFRVPGVGSQSDAELRQFIKANTPSAGDRDSAIREKLGNLRRRLEATKQAWGVDPKAPAAELLRQFGGERDDQQVSAFDVLRTDGGAGPGMAAADRQAVGGGGTTVDPYPPAMVAAHDDLVRTLASQGGGRIDPQAYAQESDRLFREFGYQRDPQSAAEWATGVNQYLEAGGRTIPTGIMPAERVMSATETMRNNLVNNPVGGAAVGLTNAFSAGGVEALAPGEMMALRDAQTLPVLAGEIAGAIGGTAAIGSVGRAAASRLAPRLLQGGARGQFARNIGTDALYGAGYGGISQGDPASGAVLGAGGSAIGQGVGRGLGAAVGGVQRTAAAEALRNRGIPISVARQIGMGRAEDLASSIPGVGEMIRRRQIDSFRGFNDAAFNEAGAPIGVTITGQVGRDGVEALDDAVGQAYTNALGGRSVPIDPQFGDDLAGAAAARMQLPDDIAGRADKLIENHIGQLEQTGQLTGEMYQRARRGLGKARNNANTIAGEFDEPYRETMTGVLDAYDNLLMRGGGQDVIEGLAAANAANKNLRILEDASLDRAKVGTQAGEVNVFTPAQLLQASRRSEAKYGGGQGLRQLAEQGQEVLPSTVPNSGTADRAMAAGALAALGLGGAGATEYATTQQAGNTANATATLGTLAATASLLGTRRGQQVLEQILMTRPQVAQRAGDAIRRRGGLFGSTGNILAQQGY